MSDASPHDLQAGKRANGISGLQEPQGARYVAGMDRLFVTRFPARLLIIDTGSGRIIQKLSAVSDCDDVFFDQAHKRIYATGGEGESPG